MPEYQLSDLQHPNGYYLHHHCLHHLCGCLSSLFSESATFWILVLLCAPQSTAARPVTLPLPYAYANGTFLHLSTVDSIKCT